MRFASHDATFIILAIAVAILFLIQNPIMRSGDVFWLSPFVRRSA